MYKPITKVQLIKGGNVIKQGHDFTLEFNLFDAEGALADLTGAVIGYKIAHRVGGVVAEGTATSSGVGRISLTVTEDIGNGDAMRVEFTLTKGGVTSKFPSNDFIRLTITPSLDDLNYAGVSTVTLEQFKTQIDTATSYATEQADRAKEYSDNIENVMVNGPVQTVNGQTGNVTGLAKQSDLTSVTQQLAEKATTSYVETLMSNITDGSPKELFYSISALTTKYPSGTTGPMLVMDSSFTDGAHSFIWDGAKWQDVGIYQSTGIADDSVSITKMSPTLRSEYLGLISNVKIPHTNLVKNGRFANSTNDWLVTNSTNIVETGVLKNTGNGASPVVSVYQDALKLNTRHYFRARVRVTNSNCTRIEIGNANGGGYIQQSNPVANQWYVIEGIREVTTSNRFNVIHRYATAATASGMSIEIEGDLSKGGGILLIDMGTSPSDPLYNLTVEEMKETFGNWLEPGDYVTYSELLEKSIGLIDTKTAQSLLKFNNDLTSLQAELLTSVKLPYSNLIKNGKFLKVTGNVPNEWLPLSTTNTVEGSALKSTATGVSSVATVYQDALKLNTRHYIRVKVRVTNSDCTRLEVANQSSGTAYIQQLNPVANQWYIIEAIWESKASNRFNLVHRYATDIIASGKVMEVEGDPLKGGGVLAIEMGADSSNPLYNLSIEEMRSLYGVWIDNGEYKSYNDLSTALVNMLNKKIDDLGDLEPPEFYDQQLNTTDDVRFQSVTAQSVTVEYWKANGELPIGTLSAPPTGLFSGDIWADTTDSETHPILRAML